MIILFLLLSIEREMRKMTEKRELLFRVSGPSLCWNEIVLRNPNEVFPQNRGRICHVDNLMC